MLVENFLLKITIFTPAIKSIFGRNKFGKSSVQNLQTRIYFKKKSRDKLIKPLTNFIIQNVFLM